MFWTSYRIISIKIYAPSKLVIRLTFIVAHPPNVLIFMLAMVQTVLLLYITWEVFIIFINRSYCPFLIRRLLWFIILLIILELLGQLLIMNIGCRNRWDWATIIIGHFVNSQTIGLH